MFIPGSTKGGQETRRGNTSKQELVVGGRLAKNIGKSKELGFAKSRPKGLGTHSLRENRGEVEQMQKAARGRVNLHAGQRTLPTGAAEVSCDGKRKTPREKEVRKLFSKTSAPSASRRQ